jgi:hypothetical protein
VTVSQCQAATYDLTVGRLDDLGGFPNCVVPDSGVWVGEPERALQAEAPYEAELEL